MDWARRTRLYDLAEVELGRLLIDREAELHGGVARLCNGDAHAAAGHGVPVAVVVSLNSVRAQRVTLLPGGWARTDLVAQWPFDWFVAVVSADDATVTFEPRFVDDVNSGLHLHCAEFDRHALSGWWVRLAVSARGNGVEATLADVRLRRLEHLNREPNCPLSPRKRGELLLLDG
jgi:hypothetical protein